MKKLGLELKSNISKINFFPGFKIQDFDEDFTDVYQL